MNTLSGIAGLAGRAAGSAGQIPTPDHVVIVMEENHGYDQIIGDTQDAPFINSLAQQGALFTDSHGVAHPSQPNYLALFSGDTQGVTSDQVPAPGSPFTTSNLADELQSKGYTFGAYAEDLPSQGFMGAKSGNYYRKHCPWTNWSDTAGDAQPFSSFPTDYSKLPTVSFVIPNIQDDMHTGSVAAGDQWLQNNLSGYIQWAKTHNSLLIVTYDEDNDTPQNHIPTLFAGPMVKSGQYAETINHYNVLRTIEAMYGLPGVGPAVAQPISDAWNAAPQPVAAKQGSAK